MRCTDAFPPEISIFGGQKCANLGFLFSFSRNVFKRCRFLGNKTLSHMLTLLFLTVWHGLHSGYIICFSMEFLIIMVEKQVRGMDSLVEVMCSSENGEPALCTSLINTKYSLSPCSQIEVTVQQQRIGINLPLCFISCPVFGLKMISALHFC